MSNSILTPSIDNLLSLPPTHPESWVLGNHPSVRRVAEHASRAAQVQCTVLISGETGTGKEILARVMHRVGPRSQNAFVPVNCAALTATLAESQLFGHEKGAFTGAMGRSLGVFRAAQGGIVFLDEVGEMPLELQPKLLRVLQEREVTPLGSSHPEKIDVQVVAATNLDLGKEVEAGRFREDLYYRLNMVELTIPALRDRAQDIPLFVDYFCRKYAEKYGREVTAMDSDMLRDFCEYHWPGNLRQLAHVIEQSYVLDCIPTLPNQRAIFSTDSSLPFMNLSKLRSAAIQQALQSTGGHKGRAAKLLGIHANTMTRLLAQIDEDSAE